MNSISKNNVLQILLLLSYLFIQFAAGLHISSHIYNNVTESQYSIPSNGKPNPLHISGLECTLLQFLNLDYFSSESINFINLLSVETNIILPDNSGILVKKADLPINKAPPSFS